MSRTIPSLSPSARRCRLEFGAFGLPIVRHEHVTLNLAHPVRLLYASDLHLGHWWTTRVPEQLLTIAHQMEPDVMLLGGDLTDTGSALASLHGLIRQLVRIAPVHAIAGNHDLRAGIDRTRSVVLAAGAHWLADEPLEQPLPIDGVLGATPGRILCAHAPSVFPAAVQAGYRLVLAGHLHGGQCVLATRHGKQYPAAWFHRWHGLRFQQGAATLLVSRGLADTFPLRFNCPREVVLCEIG